ncbi:hypothetical protein [Bartonella sp. CR127HXZ]|uniref:hypothetical protein n=1 Tax=Bartonella sp. CR127HXZ TaxID=1460985 RepID=UPI0035CF7F02
MCLRQFHDSANKEYEVKVTVNGIRSAVHYSLYVYKDAAPIIHFASFQCSDSSELLVRLGTLLFLKMVFIDTLILLRGSQ